MRSVFGISRKLTGRARRRAWVIVRSVVLHGIVLGLIGLGLFARMTESSDLQVASTRRASIMAALAVADARRRGADRSPPSAVPHRPSATPE